MAALIDIQIACAQSEAQPLPSEHDIQCWADITLANFDLADQELTIRFVDEQESQELNNQYRDKNAPTNVLSFPFECPPEVELNLLGDLVICVPVIYREAHEQQKPVMAHFTHMIVHGILHLLGFDHIDDEDANEMESLEIAILAKLSIDDPYQEH